MRASEYVEMALYVGSDIDLGSAGPGELRELFVEAVAMGYGYVLA